MAFKKGESGNPSGRPKGSELLDLQQLLRKKAKAEGKKQEDHYITEFTDFLIDNYKESDKLMVWMGDHLFGKAQQSVDLTSGGKPLLITAIDDEGDSKTQ